MKTNNLVLITNRTLISQLEKESQVTFLFPIEKFCVGFPECFKIDEIKEEGFIFVNRVLDHQGILEFIALLKKLPSNIKGIVFDDIGILNVLMEANSKLTTILFLHHMNCNSKSISCYLDYVNSVVISTDITREETISILKHTKKPLVVYSFGYVPIMYSRRGLLTNYNRHFHEDIGMVSNLVEKQSKHELRVVENEYGTVIYTGLPFNNLILRKEKNILYHLINTIFLTDEEVLKIIHAKDFLSKEYPYLYLSDKETIFQLKERDQ